VVNFVAYGFFNGNQGEPFYQKKKLTAFLNVRKLFFIPISTKLMDGVLFRYLVSLETTKSLLILSLPCRRVHIF
jgi:hypothetical protein